MSTILDAHSMNSAGSEVTDDTIKQFRTAATVAEKEKLIPLLSNAVFAELLASSRVPNPDEISAVGSLTTMFGQRGIQIDEVRYMDAASLIGAMQLHDNMKQCCLSILEAPPEQAVNCVMIFFQGVVSFSDAPFKTRILNDIRATCMKSKIYRNLFVALIAKILSIPSQSTKIANGIVAQTHKFSVVKSQLSESDCNSITVDYEDDSCWRSFFESPFAMAEVDPSVFAYTDNDVVPGYVPYHESGHSTTSDSFDAAHRLGMDRTTQFMSRITNAAPDKLALDVFWRNLEKAPQPIQESFVEGFNGTISTTVCQNIEEVKKQMYQLLSSQEGRTRLLFSNVVEIFQIIGLALLSHNGRNTLFINSLSDFALMLDLGKPIRCDHRAWCPDTAGDLYKFLYPKKLYVRHKMNAAFYVVTWDGLTPSPLGEHFSIICS
jgi:hypothetical protein